MSTDDERYAPFPLTDTQRAYLLGRGDMFALGNVSTHAYFEFDGDLDLERFATAWRLLVERHDMLRAVMLPDSMEQRVLPDAPPFVPDVVDLRRLSVAAREAELAALRERLSHEVRPADRWPLFGVTVARLRDDLVRVFIGFDGLVCDFASWHVLSGELSLLYTDPGAVLEPLSGSFRAYVLAERALRDGEEYREAEAYWHKRIAELPPPPRLPLAADPGQLARSRFVRREAELPRAEWARLTARARSAGLTPSALLLAVFSEVLAAWSEEARFTVNVPRMNRLPLLPYVERLVGEFASFSLVEVDNRARDTFEERALRIQRRLWEDLSHHQVSGAWMLRELARLHNSMDRARMPVVLTSTLAWADPEGTALDRIWTQVHGVSQTPQVFLDVQLDERQGRLVYNWDSVDELFPAGMPEAMFEAFRALLERLAHSGWRSTGLEVLPPDQRARREAVRGRPRELPAVPAHAAFLRRAAEDPGRTAVVTSAGELGYGRLARRAAGVARLLTDGGHGPGPVVGVLLDKGQEQVVAVFGALLSGAAYLPLDPAMPGARLRAVLADAGVDTVLVRGGGPHGGLPEGVRAVAVDGELPDVPVPAVEELPQGPGDLLYVLFTSGSTGTPKGVMVEHGGMVNALRETEETFRVGPDDTVLGLTALHHDMSAFDLFGVLGAGGTLVLPDPGAERDPAHWAELLRRHRVTLWNSVPAMLEMMLDDPGAAGALASLRLAFTGGDWIPPELVRSLAELAPGTRLVSVGGPSETTLWNIWHPVDALDPAVPGVPYGKPIANTAYHLLDERLRDRPDGVTGEMYVSGVGLARGYWRDTERTAAAFLVHPDTGERLYRTGDLGRYLPDGALEFVGRADLQLKVRGQRIEPAEVEAVLALHPGVERAVVTGVPADGGRRGYKALAAHVLGSGDGFDPRELRAHLRERLPEHMVPAAFLRVTAFPLTANGKVDRAALTEAAERAARPPDGPPQPAGPDGGPLELLLAEEWSRALGVDGVGPDEDFFALGGDSLLGARILTRLRGIFAGERLTARTLFETLTVTGMAEALRGAESAPGRLDLVARLHRTVSALSPEQTAAALDELGRS
ncbi:amino acid adenylation domain-containing protein [Streptomyces sp. SID4919]|uniref:non-ribosomal peptide synthetase n=1 Tax=unclassified Streptomyces TaxID=2593676 RepID=UPI0008239E5B|nr:non-ribosomal peptide synthetase [Streptomyces sp. AmelKG-E11A]MYY07955.1 amino acid adenylation domain-containing protein [Streptomyces sp. SID4919]SCK07390.1 amino acid adenylation domain-containing protein [Streptomyces sp. AmelKG-E11A]